MFYLSLIFTCLFAFSRSVNVPQFLDICQAEQHKLPDSREEESPSKQNLSQNFVVFIVIP